MTRTTYRLRLLLMGATVLALAACEEGSVPFLKPSDTDDGTVATQTSTKLIERDVEAPEVFQVNEAGLWDGRPSLGGVWVAHPDATEPERVIIRNNANGKFVIGALFRREREIPGPRIQASSDAAAALGMLAGAPVELNVTALRKEEVAPEPALVEAEAVEAQPIQIDDADTAAADNEISETALDPIAGAAAAIEASSPSTSGTPPSAPAPAQTAPSSKLDKPYIQIGIFSVEANASRTADLMRGEGLKTTILAQEANGKKFWRVVVGPAQTKSERASLLKKVKAAGFTDAYAVTN
ncbi:MAG: SPOR domain-containing protein [Rhodobacteraceae bacterium]|nr:SPOR domain-containing protein [Paracoccaceae bacterium]